MKIFLDTADFDAIATRYSTGLIDGVTTNPTLIKKSGRDPVEVIKEISEAFPKMESISAEVVADNAADMITQANITQNLLHVGTDTAGDRPHIDTAREGRGGRVRKIRSKGLCRQLGWAYN